MTDFKIEIATILRDSTHNLLLPISNELDHEIYFKRIKYFIGLLEGYRNDAYLDGIPDNRNPAKFMSVRKFKSFSEEKQKQLREECFTKNEKYPITTVGIGANIEKEDVRVGFDKLLGESGLMEKVYHGKIDLTDEQVEIIFKDSINTRLIELHNIYGADWSALKANERIAILSLYFNHPSLANDQSNFRKYIRDYVRTNDPRYLKLAAEEVLYRSNLHKQPGIQNRRNSECELLASYKTQTYARPTQAADSVKLKIAKINDTTIPLNQDSSVSNLNHEYFIWRTQMDSKVRKDHALLEGKVFRKDSPPMKCAPGDEHNCRCIAENVPDYIIIDDPVAKARAFGLYLRKGIKHRVLMVKRQIFD